ncbi:MAG TPA: alkaline phosphatase D family protein [Herpetosiphonaceae bacterium]|nr:alkaline phosphatase D family protein [Herpetosiphonaceae bacterium]
MDESCDALDNGLVSQIDRRRFLKRVGGIAGLALLGLHPDATVSAAKRAGSNPFTLGVASGDPLTDQDGNASVVLWTRLAPKPLEVGGGMPDETVSVEWQVAEDESFTLGLKQGTASAGPDFAHSVHVVVDGLRPASVYYYRFIYSAYVSPAGRTKTAPTPGADVALLSFAFASCQRWDEGFYYAYRHMKDQDLDLVVHLGDYIYENDMPADGGVRRTRVPSACRPEPITLDQYRLRYALYKTDPDLQAAHARFPWIVTWDDHEVENDYASDYPEGASEPDPSFRNRRANAYKAYYEHMPVRMGPDTRLYRRLTYGNLAEFNVLDTRQYRSNQMCGDGESAP